MARPSAAPLTGENLRGVELPGGTVVIDQEQDLLTMIYRPNPEDAWRAVLPLKDPNRRSERCPGRGSNPHGLAARGG